MLFSTVIKLEKFSEWGSLGLNSHSYDCHPMTLISRPALATIHFRRTFKASSISVWSHELAMVYLGCKYLMMDYYLSHQSRGAQVFQTQLNFHQLMMAIFVNFLQFKDHPYLRDCLSVADC